MLGRRLKNGLVVGGFVAVTLAALYPIVVMPLLHQELYGALQALLQPFAHGVRAQVYGYTTHKPATPLRY